MDNQFKTGDLVEKKGTGQPGIVRNAPSKTHSDCTDVDFGDGYATVILTHKISLLKSKKREALK